MKKGFLKAEFLDINRLLSKILNIDILVNIILCLFLPIIEAIHNFSIIQYPD